MKKGQNLGYQKDYFQNNKKVDSWKDLFSRPELNKEGRNLKRSKHKRKK